MDEERTLSPSDLSLDEIIALNKIRNSVDSEEYLETNDVDDTLRSIPNFGSKPIHHRLGNRNDSYNLNKIQNPVQFKRTSNDSQTRAQNAVRRAKNFFEQKTKIPFNPVVMIQNQSAFKRPFLAPLTRRSISHFNRSFTISNKPGSSLSSFSTQAPKMRWHSLRASLHRQTQALINSLSSVETLDIDFDLLEDFCPQPTLTSKTMNSRFTLYP